MNITSRHILEEVEHGPLVWMLRTALLVFWAILLMGVSVSVRSELEDDPWDREDGIVCSFTFPPDPGARRIIDPSLPAGRPVELVPGQATSGRLQSGDRIGLEVGYYDEWTFSADVGEHVSVTMDSDDVDAYLVVLLGDGTEVAYDDDSGTSLNARVEFVSAVAGQYTVLAASLFEEGTGQYSIQLDRWLDLQLATVP